MATLKERFEKHFPDYFGEAYYEKEDTNLGDEILSFFRQELLAIADLAEELQGDESYPELATCNISIRAIGALIRSKANELSDPNQLIN